MGSTVETTVASTRPQVPQTLASDSTAVLKTISFTRIVKRDPTASADLLAAAVSDGFCYLDLRGIRTGDQILEDVDDMFPLMAELFSLPLEKKMEFDTDKLGNLRNYGYKPAGRNTGVAKGKMDGHELFLIPQDLLSIEAHRSGPPTSSLPDPLLKQRPFLECFTTRCHVACTYLLSALSCELGLINGHHDLLENFHRTYEPSTTALAVFKYHQQPTNPSNPDDNPGGHIAHTDVGSLTMLFSPTPGLQILQPSTGTWAFVLPKPGHAIINIGDSLRFLTGLKLKSCLHRVVPNPEMAETGGIRYSMAYFMRPEYEVRFKDDSGREWSSLEWHTRKFDVFRKKEVGEEEENVLLGKTAVTERG